MPWPKKSVVLKPIPILLLLFFNHIYHNNNNNRECECPNSGLDFDRAQKELWATPEAIEEWLAQQSLKKTISEQDVANSALFLASSASAMITGQSLIIDGAAYSDRVQDSHRLGIDRLSGLFAGQSGMLVGSDDKAVAGVNGTTRDILLVGNAQLTRRYTSATALYWANRASRALIGVDRGAKSPAL